MSQPTLLKKFSFSKDNLIKFRGIFWSYTLQNLRFGQHSIKKLQYFQYFSPLYFHSDIDSEQYQAAWMEGCQWYTAENPAMLAARCVHFDVLWIPTSLLTSTQWQHVDFIRYVYSIELSMLAWQNLLTGTKHVEMSLVLQGFAHEQKWIKQK